MISQAQIKNNLSFLEAGVYLCKDEIPRRLVINKKITCLIIDVTFENNTATVLADNSLLLVPIDSLSTT